MALSPATVKKAYRKALFKVHPDKVPDNDKALAEAKFKKLNPMYEAFLGKTQ